MEGKYIYGIVETPEARSFGPCAYTIPYRDISAAVSDSEVFDFRTMTKEAAARHLLEHQRVIEEIMDSHTVIPMKLGTFAPGVRGVEEILTTGYAMFKKIFLVIIGKIEMDVVAAWNDIGSIIREIGEHPDIKNLKEELVSRPEGASLKDRMRMGAMVKYFLDGRKQRLAVETEVTLSDLVMNKRRHGLMDDSMIFNTAFLIDKDKKAEFENRLCKINSLYEEKINFRCVGPLPPYSFYTAAIKKMSVAEIKWAKGKLGLGDSITEEEIKRAYRNSALECHPDMTLGETNGQFSELNRAYNLLLEYNISVTQKCHMGSQGDFIVVKIGA